MDKQWYPCRDARPHRVCTAPIPAKPRSPVDSPDVYRLKADTNGNSISTFSGGVAFGSLKHLSPGVLYSGGVILLFVTLFSMTARHSSRNDVNKEISTKKEIATRRDNLIGVSLRSIETVLISPEPPGVAPAEIMDYS